MNRTSHQLPVLLSHLTSSLKEHFGGWLCLLVYLSSGQAASAALIAIPPQGLTNNNGNSQFRLFDRGGPARFQQVYDASAFSSLASAGGGWIRDIDLSVDVSGHPFIDVLPNLQINISTTDRSPDGLSSIFADNVGADDTVIIGPGPIQISSGGGGGFSIFDLSFNFRDHPFFYNPANGNLLLDFRIYEGFGVQLPPPAGVPLDAYDITGDSVSSVYGIGATLPTSGTASSLGLTTLFVVTPVPEPSTWALLAIGLGFLVGVNRKRIRKG
jgi:hypothetical protein